MIRLALWILGRAMKRDLEYAWSWHCNLAIMAQDAGASYKQANIRASDFMHDLFGIKTIDIH